MNAQLMHVVCEAFPASRKVYQSGTLHPALKVPLREITLHPSSGEPPLAVYDSSGPYTDPNVSIDIERGLARMRAAWIGARGDVEAYPGRRVQLIDNGLSARCARRPRVPAAARAAARALGARAVTQLAYARAGIITPEMEYVAIRENVGREARAARAARRQRLGREPADVRDGGVRARRGGGRTRHHPGEHQSPGVRADDHRPQLPGEDQRQHRQLRGHLVHGRGGRQDGVGDPLGCGHGDGPVHRAQHPHDPRMDPAQLPGADRHGADLPGAGEGRRRGRGVELGGVPRHAHRAGRAGRRLLHHPRRRAAALHPAHRRARHRHRLARRLDHGQVVPGASPRELPLRALRGDLRHLPRLRRELLARRRPATGLDRRRQRCGAVRRARDAR